MFLIVFLKKNGLGLCLDVRGYCSRRFHVQSFGHVFQVLIKLYDQKERTRQFADTSPGCLALRWLAAPLPHPALLLGGYRVPWDTSACYLSWAQVRGLRHFLHPACWLQICFLQQLYRVVTLTGLRALRDLRARRWPCMILQQYHIYHPPPNALRIVTQSTRLLQASF